MRWLFASFDPGPAFLDQPVDWYLYRVKLALEYDTIEWKRPENLTFISAHVLFGLLAILGCVRFLIHRWRTKKQSKHGDAARPQVGHPPNE
jgi:hypothetical protein